MKFNRKLFLKFFTIIVMTMGITFIYTNENVSAFSGCWGEFETCAAVCEDPAQTSPSNRQNCLNTCLFSYASCQNAEWDSICGDCFIEDPYGNPAALDYCNQARIDASNCHTLYGTYLHGTNPNADPGLYSSCIQASGIDRCQ